MPETLQHSRYPAVHPRPGRRGEAVLIKSPHKASPIGSWEDPEAMALAVPGLAGCNEINGVPAAAWSQAPRDRAGWARLAQDSALEEPPFNAKGLTPAAGAVIVERDGRVWVVAPTNAHLNTQVTFPKGTANGMDLRATALKEVFEESGLQVQLVSHLVDISRSTSRTRYYLARRLGGSPSAMCWESQAVILVPVNRLKDLLNISYDHLVVDALMARWGERESWFSPKHGMNPSASEE